MILFGRKKFISKISTSHTGAVHFPALVSIPALVVLRCCFQEGDKVFGLRILQDAAWHTQAHTNGIHGRTEAEAEWPGSGPREREG